MKKPTFIHGVVAAIVLAFIASAMVAAVTPFLGLGSVIRLAAPALALAYVLYLFRSSRQRTGRVVTLTLWAALTAITWWTGPPLAAYLLIHAGAVWLIRALYSYSGLIPALIDLGLCAISVLVFSWAFMRTGSVFVATWSYFLVQALWVAIPAKIEGGRAARMQPVTNEPFERARRQADAALRQLFSE
jgi:hypothetical protein